MSRVPKDEMSSFYREAPFWSWNDRLKSTEARRQIDEMAAGGWGGFFMHARVGLVSDYMGREWMKVVKACVSHAKKRGMCAWLYDENRWPSGFAGGAIPSKGRKYRAKYLMLSENINEEGPNFKRLNSFVTSKQGRRIETQELGADAATGGRTVYHLYQYTAGLGDEWFLGTSYVDLLEPETTREFIRVTHEPYRLAVGDHFGRTVPGIFTDEPSLPVPHGCPGPSVPWTPRLPQVFRERRGYDLMGHLPSLFLSTGDYRKVRYDFYLTVTEMFVEGFMRQLYEWCHKQGLALTGHMMAEDSISSQVQWAGAVMPFYEYMQIPGMDHLGRNLADPATAKQVSSVADQLGKERVLSELYGCSGQHLDLKARRWIADWHFALGINLLNPHLWLYTMRGARKRDFPPTISCQQPHWPKSKTLSDRNAFISHLLTRGRRITDVLVIHPVESAWCDRTPLEPDALLQHDRRFAAMIDKLLDNQVDFHFGDESLMAKYASVKDGSLAVAEAHYKAVVVPECTTLRDSTARLLADFASAGGTIFVIGSQPALVDGARRGTTILRKALDGAEVVSLAGLPAALRKAGAAPVSLVGKGARKVLYHLRNIGRERILFLANTDPDKPSNITLTVSTGDTHAGLLDDHSGNVTALEAAETAAGLQVKVGISEGSSALIALGGSAYPKAPEPPGMPRRSERIDGRWRLRRADTNALTLDRVRLQHPSAAWTAPQYVLFAADKLRKSRSAAVRYEFKVDEVPTGRVRLAIERADEWEITFNGYSVSSIEGCFMDTSFQTVDVTEHLSEGRNVVELRGPVGDDWELESIYVVGDFGVVERRGSFHITAASEAVDPHDLTTQGFSFFAGTVDLEKHMELDEAPSRALFALKSLHAGAADVLVNGALQGELLYPPYEVELKGLHGGANRLTVRLYSTLRNLLGPHHFEGPEIEWVSPGSFVDRRAWSDEYRFVKFGFSGAHLDLW